MSIMLPSCGDKNEEPETPLTKKDVSNPEINPNPLVDYSKWSIHDGKFYLDGKWTYIKAAKPLANYGTKEDCEKVKAALDILKGKYYNTIEIICYWHFFDTDGDGKIDVSLQPLGDLINEIYAKGMYPCLGVETYAVGGGTIPEGFWSKYPDAYAVNNLGKQVTDTEYGTGSKIVSIFHEGYRETVHEFIKNLVSGLPHEKILYYETTVEPQYSGTINLCYSESARKEYGKWRAANGISDASSEMPTSFPVSSSFIENATWNKFRAWFLAKWVNEDAEAFRSVAGKNAYIATDYLDADENTMTARCGDPEEFLRNLSAPNIIQVNWHWNLTEGKANQKAYDRVWKIKKETLRDWAVTEHMTFNGQDFSSNPISVLDKILENTIKQSTRFGWEFTNTLNNSKDAFCCYNDDWSPKDVIKDVDNYWGWWLYKVEKTEKGN